MWRAGGSLEQRRGSCPGAHSTRGIWYRASPRVSTVKSNIVKSNISYEECRISYKISQHERLRRRLHPLFQLPQAAGEEVVGRLDPVKLLGGGEALVHMFQLGAGTELIVGTLDEDFGGGAAFQIVGRTPARGEPGGHQEGGASRLTSQAGNDARAEGKAGQREGERGIAFAEPGERGAGVFDFAFQVSVLAGARAHAAEVKAQDDDARAAQSAGQTVDHFVVHGAAVERMGMADHGGHPRRDILGLFEQGFDPAGGTGESERLDAARHRRVSSSGSW